MADQKEAARRLLESAYSEYREKGGWLTWSGWEETVARRLRDRDPESLSDEDRLLADYFGAQEPRREARGEGLLGSRARSEPIEERGGRDLGLVPESSWAKSERELLNRKRFEEKAGQARIDLGIRGYGEPGNPARAIMKKAITEGKDKSRPERGSGLLGELLGFYGDFLGGAASKVKDVFGQLFSGGTSTRKAFKESIDRMYPKGRK